MPKPSTWYISVISLQSHIMRNIYIIVIALFISACGMALPTAKPYKLDIQQGNVVTSKMLLQLKPGMTKSQVRYIMGTPLIQDSFHGGRWDYFYQMREAGRVTEQHRVILTFKNELLDKVSGDVVAKQDGPATADDAANGTRVVNPTAVKKEEGFFEKLKFWKKEAPAEDFGRIAVDGPLIDAPVDTPVIAVPDGKENLIDATEPAKTEKGWLDKLKFWKDDEPATQSLPKSSESLSGVEVIEVPEATAQPKNETK